MENANLDLLHTVGPAEVSAWGPDLISKLFEESLSNKVKYPSPSCILPTTITWVEQSTRLSESHVSELKTIVSTSESGSGKQLLQGLLAICDPCEIDLIRILQRERSMKKGSSGLFICIIIPKVGFAYRFKSFAELKYMSAHFAKPAEEEEEAEKTVLENLVQFPTEQLGSVISCGQRPSVCATENFISGLWRMYCGKGRLLVRSGCRMEGSQITYTICCGSLGGLVSSLSLAAAMKRLHHPLVPLTLLDGSTLARWWDSLSHERRLGLLATVNPSLTGEALAEEISERLVSSQSDLYAQVSKAHADCIAAELVSEEEASEKDAPPRRSSSNKRKNTSVSKQTTASSIALSATPVRVLSSQDDISRTMNDDNQVRNDDHQSTTQREQPTLESMGMIEVLQDDHDEVVLGIVRELEEKHDVTSSLPSLATTVTHPLIEQAIDAEQRERRGSSSDFSFATVGSETLENDALVSFSNMLHNDILGAARVTTTAKFMTDSDNDLEETSSSTESKWEMQTKNNRKRKKQERQQQQQLRIAASAAAVIAGPPTTISTTAILSKTSITTGLSSQQQEPTVKQLEEVPSSSTSSPIVASAPRITPDAFSSRTNKSAGGSKSPVMRPKSASFSSTTSSSSPTSSFRPTTSSSVAFTQLNLAYPIGGAAAALVAGPRLYSLHNDIHEMAAALDLVATRRQPWQLAVAERVKQVVYAIWPRAWCDVFGSIASGLAAPCSDVDMVVRGVPQPDRVRNLAQQLAREEWVQMLQAVERTAVPVVKFYTAAIPIAFGNRGNLIAVDITFENEAHHGLNTCGLVRQFTQRWPPLKPLVLVLKQFLVEKGLNDPYVGGLSSYGLVLMVAAILKRHWPSDSSATASGRRGGSASNAAAVREVDLGLLLIEFLEVYSSREFVERGVRFSHDGVRPLADPCYIEDPLDSSNNVGRSCFGIHQVVEVFGKALEAIRSCERDPSLLTQPGIATSVLGRIFATNHHSDVVRLVTKVWCPPELPSAAPARPSESNQNSRQRYFHPQSAPSVVLSITSPSAATQLQSGNRALIKGSGNADPTTALEKWAIDVKNALLRAAKNCEIPPVASLHGGANVTSGNSCPLCSQPCGPGHVAEKCEFTILAKRCPL